MLEMQLPGICGCWMPCSFSPDERRAGRLDISKRQRIDGDTFEPLPHEVIADPVLSSAILANESAAPRAEVAKPLDDEVEEGDVSGHVTTDSSSSDSDGGDRELVQRQFFPPTVPDGTPSCSIKSRSYCITCV